MFIIHTITVFVICIAISHAINELVYKDKVKASKSTLYCFKMLALLLASSLLSAIPLKIIAKDALTFVGVWECMVVLFLLLEVSKIIVNFTTAKLITLMRKDECHND